MIGVLNRLVDLQLGNTEPTGSTRSRSGRRLGGVPDLGSAPGGTPGGLGRDGERVVPLEPVAAAPGPSIVAVLDRADDFGTATCERWLPVERA